MVRCHAPIMLHDKAWGIFRHIECPSQPTEFIRKTMPAARGDLSGLQKHGVLYSWCQSPGRRGCCWSSGNRALLGEGSSRTRDQPWLTFSKKMGTTRSHILPRSSENRPSRSPPRRVAAASTAGFALRLWVERRDYSKAVCPCDGAPRCRQQRKQSQLKRRPVENL